MPVLVTTPAGGEFRLASSQPAAQAPPDGLTTLPETDTGAAAWRPAQRNIRQSPARKYVTLTIRPGPA